MLSPIALRQTATGWSFASEAALEHFVWEHLQNLLGLTPLKSQYSSNGEICDILAVSQDKALTILELKNVEDRYLIQQLTRYYANLLAEKPFPTAIDYTQPVRLIGIAPTYHRHNLIDQEHSKLPIALLQFAVLQEQEVFNFRLQTAQQVLLSTYAIPYLPIALPAIANVPEPPDLLLMWLGGCTQAEQEGFLRVRSKLLACHPRIKEWVEQKSLHYGSGKSKLCAEILFHQKAQKPILFLWLPTPITYSLSLNRKLMLGRLRLWTEGETISHVGHVPEGWGKMRTKAEWEQLPPEKRPHMMESMSSRSRTPVEVESYFRCWDAAVKPDYWEALSGLAVKHWLERFG